MDCLQLEYRINFDVKINKKTDSVNIYYCIFIYKICSISRMSSFIYSLIYFRISIVIIET